MVEHCQLSFKPVTSGGELFNFPVNPASITIMYSRSVTQVPILGLGDVILPGTLVPAELSFETFFPRFYDSSFCNFRYEERPEESVSRLERWMGRSDQGQINPEVLLVTVSGSGFARRMVLTEMAAEYRPGEPDALYVRVSLKEWRSQSVKITRGEARPLLPERPGVGGGSGSAVDDEEALEDKLPKCGYHFDSNSGLTVENLRRRPEGDCRPEGSGGSDVIRIPPPPSHFDTKPGDKLITIAQKFSGEVDDRLYAKQIVNLNAHKWQPGGIYHEKYRYRGLNGEIIAKWLFDQLVAQARASLQGGRGQVFSKKNAEAILETLGKEKLWQPPPHAGHLYRALPAGVRLKLPTVNGSRVFR